MMVVCWMALALSSHNCYSFATLGPSARGRISARHRNPGLSGNRGLLPRPFTNGELKQAVRADRPDAVFFGKDCERCVCAYRREDGRDFHFVRRTEGGGWEHWWMGNVERSQGDIPDKISKYRFSFCYK